MSKLKYKDWRKIIFQEKALEKYPHGISLPNDNNIIEVTQKEEKSLSKKKNGDLPVFEKMNTNKKSDKEVLKDNGGEK